jgi:hypothetical protein
MSENMAGVSKLIDSLMPEFEKRTDEALKKHGWTRMSPPEGDPAMLGGPRVPQ